MRVSIAQLRAAGMTDQQIVKLMEEREAERREQNRKAQINHRTRQHEGDLRSDIADRHIDTSSPSTQNRSSRKVSISADWKPTDTDREYARTKGWLDSRIDAEGERFHNHYLANGEARKSWPASWRKWVTSPFQNGGQGGALHVRSSGQPAKYGLAEAFAEIRSELGSRSRGPADGVIPPKRLPEPKGLSADDVQHSGGLSPGDRGTRDRPEDGHSAPMQVAADAGRGGGSVRSGDWVSDEGRPELRLVASSSPPKAAEG